MCALWYCAGCTLALRREHDQCHTSEDCQSLSVGAVCSESGVCEQLATRAPASSDAEAACERDADCGDAWSVCRGTKCKALATAGCIPVSPDDPSRTRDRLALALLVPGSELSGDPSGAHLLAAATAVGELRAGLEQQDDSFPELIAVACDESDSAGYAHLLSAGVRVVLGPMRAESVESARSIIDGQAVLFSPYADAPELETPPPSPTTSIVSCKPNRRGSAAAVVSAARVVQAELQRRRLIAKGAASELALSTAEDQLGISTLFGETELDAANVRALSYVDDPPGQGLVTELQRQSLSPSLFVAASDTEDWSELIAAIDDSATFSASPYPFYLLSDKQASVAQLVHDVDGSDHPVHRRAVGLDYDLSSANAQVHEIVQSAFEQGTGRAFEPGLDYVHDCAYLATYAAIAAEQRYSLTTAQLSPEAVLVGLRSFSNGNRRLATTADLIQTVFSRLLNRCAGGADCEEPFDGLVELVGGSGDLDLQGVRSVQEIARAPAGQYVQPSPRALRLYCTDPELGFSDTGLVFATSGADPDSGVAEALSCVGPP